MSGGVEGAIRTYKHIVDEAHLCFVENHQIRVGKEVLPYFNIESVVAQKRADDFEVFACFVFFFAHQAGSLLVVGGAELVVVVAAVVHLVEDMEQGLVGGGIIHIARHHFFYFDACFGRDFNFLWLHNHSDWG